MSWTSYLTAATSDSPLATSSQLTDNDTIHLAGPAVRDNCSRRAIDLFSVKVCGITRIADGRAAAMAGADAIGLNFFSRSPRRVTLRRAAAIAVALPAGVSRVGVFVNMDAEQMLAIAGSTNLDAIQLHGDEPPDVIASLRPFPVIRAFRCRADQLDAIAQYLDRCRGQNCLPEAVLLDAYHSGQYGGTGRTVAWASIARNRSMLGDIPIILAGGLTPENVAEAIETVRPRGVDTASGVETSPGRKDGARVRAFVQTAREALNRTKR